MRRLAWRMGVLLMALAFVCLLLSAFVAACILAATSLLIALPGELAPELRARGLTIRNIRPW